MSRFRNTLTGVAVSVDDDTAARLGVNYEPVTEPAPKKTAAKRSAAPKSDKS